MNFQLIGELIGLRYKLMWAKTRTRNGKIALFLTGYCCSSWSSRSWRPAASARRCIAVRAGKALLDHAASCSRRSSRRRCSPPSCWASA